MTLRLKDGTPPSERLRPAATEAELAWFRKKRLRALGRGVMLAAGAGVLYFLGSLLRDPARAHHHVFDLVEMGFVGVMQLGLIVHAIRSPNLVKDVQAKRDNMHHEQRERIFLSALDDDVPAV